MATKTSQLQIRVSPSQKEMLKRLADESEMSVSEYVLSRALPSARRELEAVIGALDGEDHRDRALQDLSRHLGSLGDEAYAEAVKASVPPTLDGIARNCVAAAVERESARRDVAPPAWTATVEPPATPWFPQGLPSLHVHLMRVAPAAFKRRRLFVVDPDSPRA